jgi:hypothetical protein
MNVTDHYKKLGQTAVEIIEKSMANADLDLLSSNHAFLHDFDIWLEILVNRPESSILKNAIKEYQLAMLSNNQGMYQQAFMGLRFFLERTFVAIMFSANELELNLWKIGERDTYWNEIASMDKDRNIQGVFSEKFCRAFFPDLNNERPHFFTITTKVYRECSEFVHGNKSVIDKIPEKLEYSKELFYEWNIKADIIRRIILFVFCLRYINQLTPKELKKISPTISEEFNSIPQIIEKLNN